MPDCPMSNALNIKWMTDNEPFAQHTPSYCFKKIPKTNLKFSPKTNDAVCRKTLSGGIATRRT